MLDFLLCIIQNGVGNWGSGRLGAGLNDAGLSPFANSVIGKNLELPTVMPSRLFATMSA